MRIGDFLVEAKLTEGDFQRAPLRLLMRYRDLKEVHNIGDLPIADGLVLSWQLVRGVLAAHACSASFVVLCDHRRPDLIDGWYEVMRAASSYLRTLLGVLTWQEISTVIPKPVREFPEGKYGI